MGEYSRDKEFALLYNGSSGKLQIPHMGGSDNRGTDIIGNIRHPPPQTNEMLSNEMSVLYLRKGGKIQGQDDNFLNTF